jgi:hypothetical protein
MEVRIMATKKCTGPAERSDIAQTAAGQLERICLSFMAQSAPDSEHGTDPRPIPAVAVYELAARGRELAVAIMDALGDSIVPADELRKIVRSAHGTFEFPAVGGRTHG